MVDTENAPRPLTGGAVIATVSRLTVTLAGGITAIVLARLLGPKDWAGYSIALSLVATLAAVTSLGMQQGVAYFVSSRSWDPRSAFGSAMKMAFVTGTLGIAAGLVGYAAFPSAFAGLPFWLTAVAAVAIPFALVLSFVSTIALSIDRYEASMSMPALQAGLLLALAVPAAVLFGRAGAVVAMTVATVVVAGGAVAWARRRLPERGPSRPGKLRQAISFGIKGSAANALQLVNLQVDLFILAAVVPAATVGQYSLAVSLTLPVLLLPSALATVLDPRIARLSTVGDDPSLEMVETKSLRHVSLIVGVTTLGLAGAVEFLVVPVFGSAYRASINLGLILLPGTAALGVTAVLAATVIGRGKPLYSLYAALIATPVTLALYGVLIPWRHATGAAVASTVSYAGTFLLFCHFYRRVTGRRVAPLLLPTRSEFADLIALVRAVPPRLRRG
jgi:O-antigen/teichoic acid export membrane protein